MCARSLRVILLLVSITALLAACRPVTREAAEGAVEPKVMLATQPGTHVVLATDPVEMQIANAMAAAPRVVAQDATLLGYPTEAGGAMVVLREGTNDWTCITDWADSPVNDPWCIDPVFTAWNDAARQGRSLGQQVWASPTCCLAGLTQATRKPGQWHPPRVRTGSSPRPTS